MTTLVSVARRGSHSLWLATLILLAPAASSSAERIVFGTRTLELSEPLVEASAARIRVFKRVAGKQVVVRDVPVADLPIVKGDCPEGECSAADPRGQCVGRCIRSAPMLLAVDRRHARAFVYALTGTGSGTPSHVLFEIDVRTGSISRLERVEATVIERGKGSPDGRFLSYLQYWRGGPQWSLRVFDRSTGRGVDDEEFLNGYDAGTYTSVEETEWLPSGRLVIRANIGVIDRDEDPQSGTGPVLQSIRVVYDPRKRRVVSKTVRSVAPAPAPR